MSGRRNSRDNPEHAENVAMDSYEKLLSELKRHNLLKILVRSQIITEEVNNINLSKEEADTAKKEFFKEKGIKSESDVSTYQNKESWNDADLEWNATLQLRVKKYCEQNYEHKAESYFLAKKNDLDRVVYSLIRSKDPYLIQELYLRIESNEQNFGDLAAEYSEGMEKQTKGIVGPVPMTQAHPAVAETLRVSKPGRLNRPMKLGELWLILRLESYKPAIFNPEMSQRLTHEMFNNYVNTKVSERIQQLNQTTILA